MRGSHKKVDVSRIRLVADGVADADAALLFSIFLPLNGRPTRPCVTLVARRAQASAVQS